MGTPTAIIVSGSLIAAALAWGVMADNGRYSVTQLGPGVVVRLNNSSGAMEACGDAERVLSLVLSFEYSSLKSAGFSMAEIMEWRASQMARTGCLPVGLASGNGPTHK